MNANHIMVYKGSFGHSECNRVNHTGETKTPYSKVIKLFFMLNSDEHEILNARKYKKISRKSAFFKAEISLECYFSCS